MSGTPDLPDRDDERAPVAGARHVHAQDPAAAAGELAASLDAELVTGAVEAAAALDRRLTARLTDDAGANPPLSAADLADVRRLADDLARAQRIRLRTEVEFTETLSRKLSRGTALAVHPEALYGAARAVVEATAAHDIAVRAIEDLGSRSDAVAVTSAPAPQPSGEPAAVYDDEALERSRERTFLAGIAAAAIGLAVILGVFVLPLLAIVPPLVALPVVWAMVRRARLARGDLADRLQASSNLAAASATADHATANAAASRKAGGAWTDQHALLEARRDTADEKLRAALRAWESLAGPTADPHDVESVVQARDPQFQLTGTSAQASPTMRTVNAFHRRALARWKITWARLGWSEAPEVEAIDEALERLEAQAADRAAQARPLVLAEPYDEASTEQRAAIERDVAELATAPGAIEIVIVEREVPDDTEPDLEAPPPVDGAAEPDGGGGG